MTASPIKLVTKEHKHRDGVLTTIKNAQTMIDSENIVGFAFAAVDREGFTHTAFESGENIALMIGAVECLKSRLLKYRDDE